MLSEQLAETVLAVILAVGAPLLVALFYTEGLLVGKVLQPSTVFVAYVVAVDPTRLALVVLVSSCLLAALFGQWTLYREFDEGATPTVAVQGWLPYARDFPARVARRIGGDKLRIVDRVFDRFGVLSIVTTSALPGIRGVMVLPAALRRYPLGRFLAATALGTLLYFVLLVAAAYGLAEFLRSL